MIKEVLNRRFKRAIQDEKPIWKEQFPLSKLKQKKAVANQIKKTLQESEKQLNISREIEDLTETATGQKIKLTTAEQTESPSLITTQENIEANIINDPEAADIVFSANCKISMVGLDVTNKVFMSKEEIDTICQFDDPRSQHLKKIIPFYYEFLSSFFGKEGMPTHDSSAITYFLDRSLFSTLNYPIKVETEGISRGKTWMGTGISRNEGGPSERLKPWEGRKNVNVCVDVDSKKVIDLILERLSY